MPDGTPLREVNEKINDYESEHGKIKDYFSRKGMIEPTESRGGPSLDQRIEWLFLDLRNPDTSWATKAKWINKGQQALDDEAREGDLSSAPRYSPTNIATHTNTLRQALSIQRLPGRRDQFG